MRKPLILVLAMLLLSILPSALAENLTANSSADLLGDVIGEGNNYTSIMTGGGGGDPFAWFRTNAIDAANNAAGINFAFIIVLIGLSLLTLWFWRAALVGILLSMATYLLVRWIGFNAAVGSVLVLATAIIGFFLALMTEWGRETAGESLRKFAYIIIALIIILAILIAVGVIRL